MKVLIVSHLLAREPGGGVRMRAIAVARALVREGVDVHLLGTDTGMTPADAADLADLPVTPVRSVLPRFAVPLRAARQVAQLAGEADVVLLFNHWTLLNVVAFRAARRQGVAHVICPSGALTWGTRSHAIKRVYQAVAGARIVREAARCVATTERERADAAAFGVPDDRIEVIPNAIDLPDIEQRHATTEPKASDTAALRERLGVGDAPLLLFMGRLNPIKGPDLLVEAFARIAADHPEYRLVFAGRDEGMQAALTARAEALRIRGRIHFAGMLDRTETEAAYRAAALLVVPSRQEAMSLVALEAGMQGTPVMMTDVCGFDELERVGGGLLAPPTVDGLADGLRRLLASSGDLPRLGRALRAHVVATYGWPSVAPRWVSVLTAAAGTRRFDSRSRRSSARTPA
jgi:glycosyltransferase involved in cell wall biosynthesis